MLYGLWVVAWDTGDRDGEGVSLLKPILPLLTGEPLRARFRC